MKLHAEVRKPDGTIRKVKNLGWIIRNWKNIASLEWQSTPHSGPVKDSGVFAAYMRDGSKYLTEYASYEVFQQWVKRPVFEGLKMTVNGVDTVVGR